MRTAAILALMAGLMAMPALAGNVGLSEGKPTWESTKCTAPTPPKSVLEADRHSAANDVNVLVTQYNQYVAQTEAYMNCMSEDAENDANATSIGIASAAKAKIDSVHQAMIDMGKPLQGKGE